MFGPNKGEIAGWGMLQSEKISSLCSSANKITVMKSRRMREAEHVVRMLEEIYANRILVGKPEGKRPFGILA